MLSGSFQYCLETFDFVWKHQRVKVDGIFKSYLMFTVAPLVVPPSINWMHALSPPFNQPNPSEFRSKSSSANQQWEFFWPNTFYGRATQVWDEIYVHRCLSWNKNSFTGLRNESMGGIMIVADRSQNCEVDKIAFCWRNAFRFFQSKLHLWGYLFIYVVGGGD